MSPEITAKTGNAAQFVPEAEPVGAFAAASAGNTAKAAADKTAAPSPAGKAAAAPPPRPAGPKRRKFYSALSLFTAALSGAVLALLGFIGLEQAGFYPGAARPQPPAAPGKVATLETEAAKAQIEALFAQKSRLFNEQTAEAAQIVQNIVDKAGPNSAEAPAAANMAALKNRVEILERRQQDSLAKIKALYEDMAQLRQKGQQAQGEAVRLLALQNLQAAFDSGAPYKLELQIFGAAFPQALAAPAAAFITPAQPEPGALTIGAALARYQAAGLPNKAVLARDFTLLADRLAAQGPAAESGSAAAGWQSRLARWITVRPQGAVAGAGMGAVLARLEAALAGGDYKTALAEAAALPPPAQQAARAYTDIICLRLAADNFFRHTAQAVFSPGGAPAGADRDHNRPGAAAGAAAETKPRAP